MNSNAVILLIILAAMLAVGIYNLWFSYQVGIKNKTLLLLNKRERNESSPDLSSARRPAALISLGAGVLTICAVVFILSIKAPLLGILRLSGQVLALVAMTRNAAIQYYKSKAKAAQASGKS